MNGHYNRIEQNTVDQSDRWKGSSLDFNCKADGAKMVELPELLNFVCDASIGQGLKLSLEDNINA